ncbi:MAG: cell wall-binding repeat-containing protein [Coriobacteriia bacterium]|nr:cell wall-binding repeat-containing protein [Coriobacteriia bacterium]
MSSRHGPLRRAALVGVVVAGLVIALGAPGIALGAEMAVSVTDPVAIEVEGSNRVLTAIEASKKFGAADDVVLATGMDFPDALGAAALAGAVDGPILLTGGTTLEGVVLTEIQRLGADKVWIVGGTGVVSSAIETSLKGAGLTVERVAGANRYATAKAVADKTIALLGTDYDGGAFMATGVNFADALAAAPIMYAKGMPLVLCDAAGTYTLSAGMEKVVLLGGTGVVPASVQTALGVKYDTRLSGALRYDTAIKVAEYGVATHGMSWNNLGIATGEAFPDALCAGPLLGKNNSVLLTTPTASLWPATATKLSAIKTNVTQYYLFGGDAALTPGTRTAIATALRPDAEPEPEPLTGHDLPDVFCTGAGCHGPNLAAIHIELSNGGCYACHTYEPERDCDVCHSADAEWPAHVTAHVPVESDSAEACTQAGCHAAGVVEVHELAGDCTVCHNDTTTIVAGMTCEDCHAPTEVQHADIAVHTVVNTGGGCFDGYCHGTDVTVMHGEDFRLSGLEAPGCSACHNDTVTPSVVCLGACHSAGQFGTWHADSIGHADLETSIEAESAGCVSCHGSNLMDVAEGEHIGCSCHAYGTGVGATSCESCHTLPMDPDAPHPYHVDAHAVIEDTIEANSAGCVSCHGTDLMNVAPGEHDGCSCHAYGYGQGEEFACEDCHTDPMDPDAAHPYHVGAHDTFEATVAGDVSGACVDCHGSDLLAVGGIDLHVKDAHAGCTCHAYDELAATGFELINSTTDMAGECVDCHSGAFAPHGFSSEPSVHHAETWVAASGHNTTAFGTIGAVEDFSALLTGTDGNPVTDVWPFPTVNVFWEDGDADAPADAMTGLVASDVVTCEDCHTGFTAAGPHGADDNWGIDPAYDADFSYAELTKNVAEYPSGIRIRTTLTTDTDYELGTEMTICSKCHDLQNYNQGTVTGQIMPEISTGSTPFEYTIPDSTETTMSKEGVITSVRGTPYWTMYTDPITWAPVASEDATSGSVAHRQSEETGTVNTNAIGSSNTAHSSHHQDTTDGSAQCVNCHIAIPHGWKAPRLLVNTGWAGGVNGIHAGVIEGDRAPYRDPDVLGTDATEGTDMLLNPATGYNGMGALTWPASGPTEFKDGAAIWDRYTCEGCGHHYHAVQERDATNVRIITNSSDYMDDYNADMVAP